MLYVDCTGLSSSIFNLALLSVMTFVAVHITSISLACGHPNILCTTMLSLAVDTHELQSFILKMPLFVPENYSSDTMRASHFRPDLSRDNRSI